MTDAMSDLYSRSEKERQSPPFQVYQPHLDAESLRRDIDIQNSRINEINIVLNNAIRRLAALEEKR